MMALLQAHTEGELDRLRTDEMRVKQSYERLRGAWQARLTASSEHLAFVEGRTDDVAVELANTTTTSMLVDDLPGDEMVALHPAHHAAKESDEDEAEEETDVNDTNSGGGWRSTPSHCALIFDDIDVNVTDVKKLTSMAMRNSSIVRSHLALPPSDTIHPWAAYARLQMQTRTGVAPTRVWAMAARLESRSKRACRIGMGMGSRACNSLSN